MQKATQHLGHVMRVIMLDVVRAINRVVGAGGHKACQLPRIAEHVGPHALVDIEEMMRPAGQIR
jgi:hypothetical protein